MPGWVVVLLHTHLPVLKGLEAMHTEPPAQGTAHVGVWSWEQVSGPALL